MLFKRELSEKLKDSSEAMVYIRDYKLPAGVLEKGVEQGINKITKTDNANSPEDRIRLDIVNDSKKLSIAGLGLIIDAYIDCLGKYEDVVKSLAAAPKVDLGKLIEEKKALLETEIDLMHVGSGLYFVSVINDLRQIQIVKVIKLD